jgi:hypothetical protein
MFQRMLCIAILGVPFAAAGCDDDAGLQELIKVAGACAAYHCDADGQCVTITVPDGTHCTSLDLAATTCVAGECRRPKI